jgi:hypothetical protein
MASLLTYLSPNRRRAKATGWWWIPCNVSSKSSSCLKSKSSKSAMLCRRKENWLLSCSNYHKLITKQKLSTSLSIKLAMVSSRMKRRRLMKYLSEALAEISATQSLQTTELSTLLLSLSSSGTRSERNVLR